MKTIILAAVSALVLSSASVLAQEVESYDDTWYRASFWSGEYPAGFTVVKDTTVQLRPRLDPSAEKTIACDLPARATYQPWNRERVEEQGLTFVSFTRIGDYRVTKPFAGSFYRNDDATQVDVSLKPGDTWRYLVYFAEGAFLMEYEGVRYDGNQDLIGYSQQMGDAAGYHEWLRINCPNNQWGWLNMGDISLDDDSFASPNITGYGEAKDLD